MLRGRKEGKTKADEVHGEFRLAWLWVEGWRAQLRKSGDIIEQSRWEWRLDEVGKLPNQVPVIVAKNRRASALRGSIGSMLSGRTTRKSVRFE